MNMDDFHHWNLGCPNSENMWTWMTWGSVGLGDLIFSCDKLKSEVIFPKIRFCAKDDASTAHMKRPFFWRSSEAWLHSTWSRGRHADVTRPCEQTGSSSRSERILCKGAFTWEGLAARDSVEVQWRLMEILEILDDSNLIVYRILNP